MENSVLNMLNGAANKLQPSQNASKPSETEMVKPDNQFSESMNEAVKAQEAESREVKSTLPDQNTQSTSTQPPSHDEGVPEGVQLSVPQTSGTLAHQISLTGTNKLSQKSYLESQDESLLVSLEQDVQEAALQIGISPTVLPDAVSAFQGLSDDLLNQSTQLQTKQLNLDEVKIQRLSLDVTETNLEGAGIEENIQTKPLNPKPLPDVDVLAKNQLFSDKTLEGIQLEKANLSQSLSSQEIETLQQIPKELTVKPMTATTPSTADNSVKAQLMVSTPFQQGQTGWSQDVGEQLTWMSKQGIKEAEIHLDPPELGPLQVKVTVEKDQAHVSFVVQHSSVREALDQNAMRLREMFEAEGLNLANLDVSDQSQQRESQGEGGSSAETSIAAQQGEESDSINNKESNKSSIRLVDAFV